jgi:hypothetical protein
LVGILVVYALIVTAGGSRAGGVVRVLALGLLLVGAFSTRRRAGRPGWHTTTSALVVALVAVAAAGVTAIVANRPVFDAVLAAVTAAIVGITIVVIVQTLVARNVVDAATVLGALCVYLLLALLFAALHQIGAAFDDTYLHGVSPPASGDFLYFSVMTLTTVGYGDLTPATAVGRTVAMTEALVGQLYLVSVVAAVVGRWRRSET